MVFTITFNTLQYRPDILITLKTSNNWDKNIPGLYEGDGWNFELDVRDFPNGIRFKFVLQRSTWMNGNDIYIGNVNDGARYTYGNEITFPPLNNQLITENNRIAQLFFAPNFGDKLYDVIVIGSGIGGGIVADQLSDAGIDTLVLEAGTALFPTHIANLPRQHWVGVFDKNVWSLWDEFQINNSNLVDPTVNWGGAQAFNLGGRSVFWGGLVPRMTSWELDQPWPKAIKDYLLNQNGYDNAEKILKKENAPVSPVDTALFKKLSEVLPAYNVAHAPLAVQYNSEVDATIPAGMFSTADLLMESRLTNGRTGNQFLTVNLNNPVEALEVEGNQVVRVRAHDMVGNVDRTYRGKLVVLSAGTIESAKIVQVSKLADPSKRVGWGITDHPIYYTHFALPDTSPFYNAGKSSKIALQHKSASAKVSPYNVVIELGTDFNQGRFIDDDIFDQNNQIKGNKMLCEIVFLFHTPLVETNSLLQKGDSFVKPDLDIHRSTYADPYWQEINEVKNKIIAAVGGVALEGNLDLQEAYLGGVAHEVGTLRIGEVLDENLKYKGYNNLYVCDLSVFPTSPAANPTLTLAALSNRLANHIRTEVLK